MTLDFRKPLFLLLLSKEAHQNVALSFYLLVIYFIYLGGPPKTVDHLKIILLVQLQIKAMFIFSSILWFLKGVLENASIRYFIKAFTYWKVCVVFFYLLDLQ